MHSAHTAPQSAAVASVTYRCILLYIQRVYSAPFLLFAPRIDGNNNILKYLVRRGPW